MYECEPSRLSRRWAGLPLGAVLLGVVVGQLAGEFTEDGVAAGDFSDRRDDIVMRHVWARIWCARVSDTVESVIESTRSSLDLQEVDHRPKPTHLDEARQWVAVTNGAGVCE
jgi:hypothetical protein